MSFLLFAAILAAGVTMPQTPAQPASQATPGAGDAENVPRAPKPEAAQAMARAQELLFHENDAEASIAEFKKAVRIDPWYGQGYLLLGVAYTQLQRWSQAELAFEEATKVGPGNAQAYLGLGSALNEQKDYLAAQKALQHSLDLQPNSGEAHYELARTLGALGKWQAAELHARRAIALNPDYPGSHALMGNVYLQRHDPESARKEFVIYLQMAPQGSLAEEARQMLKEIDKQTRTRRR